MCSIVRAQVGIKGESDFASRARETSFDVDDAGWFMDIDQPISREKLSGLTVALALTMDEAVPGERP